nr:ferritin-like domain-containing protein [Rhodovibrio sodomensis]
MGSGRAGLRLTALLVGLPGIGHGNLLLRHNVSEVSNASVPQPTVIRNLRAAVSVAEAHDDPATADLLTERLGAHEKQVWMMRSMQA